MIVIREMYYELYERVIFFGCLQVKEKVFIDNSVWFQKEDC